MYVPKLVWCCASWCSAFGARALTRSKMGSYISCYIPLHPLHPLHPVTSVTSVYIRDIPFTYKRNAVTRYYTRYARDVTHMTLHPLHTITLHLLHTVNRVTHITLRHMPACRYIDCIPLHPYVTYVYRYAQAGVAPAFARSVSKGGAELWSS